MRNFNDIVILIESDFAEAHDLLTEETLRVRNSVGETLLHFFAVERNIAAVKLLLDKGAEIDPIDTGHRTPLMEAAMLGHSDIVQLLLQYGADPKLQAHGETALRNALSSRMYEVADILIEAGADVNQRDPMGETILFEAVRTEDVDMIRYLLGKGCNENIKNINKETVLDMALENEDYTIAEILKQARRSKHS
ncbi:ankyrin repeat domain-containing protein [bacterium]|nr:ankyrin repeat domain-containing protein [bacterium]